MLTTVCTACQTAFRITPEQLKLREGRVRCGRCETVFNALATLTQQPAPETPAATPGPATGFMPFGDMPAGTPEGEPGLITPPPAVAADAPGTVVPEFNPLEPDLADDPAPSPALQPEQETQAPEPPPAPEPPVEWPVIDPGALAPLQTSAPARIAEEPAPAPVERAPAAETPAPPRAAAAAPAFDFGPKPAAPRRSRWWAPLAVLFLLTLVGQAAYYFRGAIAFMVPEAKPYISEICAELGCEVPLPRRAELISIETSDLQADPTNPGIIVLLATLRNRAAFPQTFPALELTLTNEREQPLARRVLLPGDYLADRTEAFEGSSEKQIRLNIEAGSIKASGYRLYLFYP